ALFALLAVAERGLEFQEFPFLRTELDVLAVDAQDGAVGVAVGGQGDGVLFVLVVEDGQAELADAAELVDDPRFGVDLAALTGAGRQAGQSGEAEQRREAGQAKAGARAAESCHGCGPSGSKGETLRPPVDLLCPDAVVATLAAAAPVSGCHWRLARQCFQR